MDCIRRVALIANCGYARVCIYENSDPKRNGRSARQTIDIAKRQAKFKEQFSSTFSYPDGYFDKRSKDATQFDRDCTKILDGFKPKFLKGGDKETYLSLFSKKKNGVNCLFRKETSTPYLTVIDAMNFIKIASSLSLLSLLIT